jgi:hypothetical protein
MEIIDIKIKRHKEIVRGIKIFENDAIVLIINNPNDFVLDGYSFINKKYISEIKTTDDDLKLKVFDNKIIDFNYQKYLNYSLNSINEIVDDMMVNFNLVELYFESSSYSIIGKITKLNLKTFLIDLLSVKAMFIRTEKFYYDKLRIISFDNDYLKSLEFLIK